MAVLVYRLSWVLVCTGAGKLAHKKWARLASNDTRSRRLAAGRAITHGWAQPPHGWARDTSFAPLVNPELAAMLLFMAATDG